MKCHEVAITAFCNTPDIGEKIDVMKALFDEFYKFGFMMSTIQLNTIEINGNETATTTKMKPVDRPQLINKKNNEVINILPERIDYIIGFTEKNDISVTDAKCGIDYLKKILNLLSKKSSRVALNVGYTSSELEFDVNRQIQNSFFSGKEVNSISSRYGARETFQNEAFNVIQQMNYSDLPLTLRSGARNTTFTGMFVLNDINTHQSNTSERFDYEQIETYINQAIIYEKELMDGLND